MDEKTELEEIGFKNGEVDFDEQIADLEKPHIDPDPEPAPPEPLSAWLPQNRAAPWLRSPASRPSRQTATITPFIRHLRLLGLLTIPALYPQTCPPYRREWKAVSRRKPPSPSPA